MSLRPWYRACRVAIRSTVPSVDEPSTKRISVWVPRSGILVTAASMLFTSFRQGTTTVQLRGLGRGRGRMGRATTMLTRLK